MAPRKMTDKRALKIIKEAMTPYLRTLAFGANLYDKGVCELFAKRGYKRRDEVKRAIEHIEEILDCESNR